MGRFRFIKSNNVSSTKVLKSFCLQDRGIWKWGMANFSKIHAQSSCAEM